MSIVLIVLMVLGLLTGVPGWAGADERATHRGVGIVTALSSSEITLKEGEERHTMRIGSNTKISIRSEDRVRGLGVGDYVAEECVPDGTGHVRAIKLVLYRPAWMENASPEQ
jgi:hypothetical protein